MTAAMLIREARREAGLTQTELAARTSMPQSTIARLETAGSNPTVRTLERVLAAAGRRLELGTRPGGGVDRSLIARNLAMSPVERLAAFRVAYGNVRATVTKARRAGARLA